jgi:hypothetical protein
LDKYGVEHFSKTDEYLIKTRNTCLEKYGVKHPLQNKKIIKKLEKTNLKKYGVKCTLSNDEIKLKIVNTNIEKYGIEIPLKNKEIIDKLIDTNLKKYSNKSPLLNKEIREKSLTKLFENYGVYNPLKSDIIKDRVQKTRVEKLLKKYSDINIISISGETYTFHCDCNENHTFHIASNLLYHRLKYKTILCTECNKVNSYNNSGVQIQLTNFIKENYLDEIILNNREIINPHEIDIYLPKIKLAFEFNGLYWHSDLYKDKNYHINKTEFCEKKHIQLIHIYEDEWLFKNDIVKSNILNLLGKSEKINARKCEIFEIADNQLIRNFLNTNYIQGFINSNINLGLFYNGELESVLTLEGQFDSYELLRFCDKLNTTIIDGVNKLFQYFIEKYSPKEVICLADRSWYNGDLHEKIGFTLTEKTKPNQYYVIDNVKKMYSELTEGSIKIYDSGNLKFKYVNKYVNR